LEFVEMGAVQEFSRRQDTMKRASEFVTRSDSQYTFDFSDNR
jgi:hypothetical protein